jgi:protein involved in polysaccharide export with SLBB domain
VQFVKPAFVATVSRRARPGALRDAGRAGSRARHEAPAATPAFVAFVLAVACGVMVPAAASGQSTAQATPPAPATASPAPSMQSGAPPDPSAPASDAAANAILYPGDLVRLKIWREPDLSGDFQVDEHGFAVFPKIGQVHVSDITTDSLRRMLIGTYSQYLKDPSIEVTMLRRVTVIGAVKNPGLYPIDPTMTIADVLALAGGADPTGMQDKVDVIRGGSKQRVKFTQRTSVGSLQVRSGDELYLPERSWVSRNGYVVGAIIGAAVLITTTAIVH